MNWYRLSQSQVQNKPSYLDIGHGITDDIDKSQVWALMDGKIEVYPAIGKNGKSGHDAYWQGDDFSYYGRFEPKTKNLSISCPSKHGTVPSAIMKKLYNTFGTDINVYQYGLSLYATSQPQKVVLAQNLPLFDKIPEPKKKGLEVIPISCSHEGDLALTINGKRYDYVITYPYIARDLLDELIYFSQKGWGKQIKRRIDWLDQYRVK
jgi:hypothetical protein